MYTHTLLWRQYNINPGVLCLNLRLKIYSKMSLNTNTIFYILIFFEIQCVGKWIMLRILIMSWCCCIPFNLNLCLCCDVQNYWRVQSSSPQDTPGFVCKHSVGNQGLTLISQLWFSRNANSEKGHGGHPGLWSRPISVYWLDTMGQRRKHHCQLPAKPHNKKGRRGERDGE